MQHDEIQQIFLLECDEGLDLAERALLACKDGNEDQVLPLPTIAGAILKACQDDA